jgi:hypothetical protein
MIELKVARPSEPVEMIGFIDQLPLAMDFVFQVDSERKAHEIIQERIHYKILENDNLRCKNNEIRLRKIDNYKNENYLEEGNHNINV